MTTSTELTALQARALEAKEAAGVDGVSEVARLEVPAKEPLVVHPRELDELELREHRSDLDRVVDPVCVEADARLTDREREEKLTTWGQYSLQLGSRLLGPGRVEWIAVAPEADVFGNVEARERFDGAACEGKVEQAGRDARQALDLCLEWPDVDEHHLGQARQEANPVDPRADIDVARRRELRDVPRGPDVLEEVVLVVWGGRQPVMELRIQVAAVNGLCSGEAPISPEVAEEPGVAASSCRRSTEIDDGLDEPDQSC